MEADLHLYGNDPLYLHPSSDSSDLMVKSESPVAMVSAQSDVTHRASGMLNGCLMVENEGRQRLNFELCSNMFDRWCQVGTDRGLTSDSQIASFLLDQYDSSGMGTLSHGVCFYCNAPLTLTCSRCNLTPKQRTSSRSAKHTNTSKMVPADPDPVVGVKTGTDSESTNLWPNVDPTSAQAGTAWADAGPTLGQRSVLSEETSQTDTTSQRKRRRAKSSQPAVKKRKVRSRHTVAAVTNTSQETNVDLDDNDFDDIAVSFGQSPTLEDDAKTVESPDVSLDRVKIETDHVGEILHLAAEPKPKKNERKGGKKRQGNKSREPILCPECPSTFTRKSDLEKHVRKHTGERPFRCNLCPAAYTQNNNLKFHIQSQHTGERPWICDECGVACIRKCDLKVHMLKHSGVRPYVCSQCNTSFTQKGALRVHMRIHTNDRPYLCKECGSAFRQEGNLQRHMRRHTGERPYRCTKCHATFAETGTLKIHMRRHTGDRPYVCDVCSAAFTAQGALTIHRRSHTGHRPYVCRDCGAKFTHNGGLRRHERTHTGAKPHVCSQCGTAFAESYALKTHIRKVHRDADEIENVSLETVESSLMAQIQ